MSKAIHGEWTGSEVLLWDYAGAARALSLSRAALRDLVYKGRGPRVTKIGRRTFFAVKDLEAFIDHHREPPAMQSQEQTVMRKRRPGRPTIAEQMAAGKLWDRYQAGRDQVAHPAFRCASFASSSARKSPVRFA